MDERTLTRKARRLINACKARGLSVPGSAERIRLCPGPMSYVFAVYAPGFCTTVTVSAAGVSASLQGFAGAPRVTEAPRGLTSETLAFWIEVRPLEIEAIALLEG
jgi:hypothetical protein